MSEMKAERDITIDSIDVKMIKKGVLYQLYVNKWMIR